MIKSILIIDFGSQYTHLIGRKIRELGLFCEIKPPKYIKNIDTLKQHQCIVLSGGPDSVLSKKSPSLSIDISKITIPILGICYGFQYISHELGGKILKTNDREYGNTLIEALKSNLLFKNTPKSQKVWMSHGDSLNKLPKGFKIIAKTKNNIVAAITNNKNIYALQFHPEVTHSDFGKEILSNFLFKICKFKKNWSSINLNANVKKYLNLNINEKQPNIICAVSGGVDSTVLAFALSKHLNTKNLHFVFVNNGLLRKYDESNIRQIFKSFKLKLNVINAENLFVKKLKNTKDPEKKRKIIGSLFIDVFNNYLKSLKKKSFYLAQGTLYTDIIESTSYHGGKSATIKSHHNVGGLPKDINFNIIEPFKELFKDEVRKLGSFYKLNKDFISRHPFPGPGLGIRCIGNITKERLDTLRDVDEIFIQYLRDKHLYNLSWQAFAVLLPVRSVGVMGDERTYEETVVLRCINSVDGMTANVTNFPIEVLSEVATLIINKVSKVNKVLYDITSKPPSTIEWE
ncbi:MAG: glutamine-hydrolyzing GMP synthase [Alphaproteobacteria bacterium]|nr:glutamine-hydrolyzing GMP synthase [Alphaproteobacteria bacterium]MDG2457451.1 glutamine-hydrolyzing GMP synthase [Alphaproteobacteria bacterium]